MRVLLQRVREARVEVEGRIVGEIGPGLLLFLGIGMEDSEQDIEWLGPKICSLRIFSDDEGLMNKSLLDNHGDILLVSQFTLFAQTKKGNRPGFTEAARPPFAVPLYQKFQKALEKIIQKPISTGIFGADMQVQLLNDGPVTIWIDSRNRE